MTEQLNNGPPPCPLCLTPLPARFTARGDRQYFRCPRCTLVFLDPTRRPRPEEEIARYNRHHNAPDDPGYTAFLMQLVEVIARSVPAGASGIDYGCGPVPVLSMLLSDVGYPIARYDPYFFPDATPLQRRYDFVTCCEVAEHAFSPRQLFESMRDLVDEAGKIAVMTRLYDRVDDFANWWYVRDNTHVSFYSSATLQWIAEAFGWTLIRPADNIALFSVG